MVTDQYFVNAMVRALEVHAEVRPYDDSILCVAIAGIVVAFISIVGSILVTIWIYKKQNAIVQAQMKIANEQTAIANEQNKIALFEKHYLIYGTYIKSRQVLDLRSIEKYASLGYLNMIQPQIDKIMAMQDEIFAQYNKAKFLCNDDPLLVKKLKEIAYRYIEVSNLYFEIQPKHIDISRQAWGAVHVKFPCINDFPTLFQNEDAKKIFVTHSTTPESECFEALIKQ